jgi:hypothetical protein
MEAPVIVTVTVTVTAYVTGTETVTITVTITGAVAVTGTHFHRTVTKIKSFLLRSVNAQFPVHRHSCGEKPRPKTAP